MPDLSGHESYGRAADRPYVDRPVTDLERAERAATTAAAAWDLAPPRLLRRGMNALFTCGGATVLRVGNATAAPELGQRLARTLLEHGVPTTEPVDRLAGVFDGRAVSAWVQVTPIERPIDWIAVGAAVRRVHELSSEVVPDGYPVPDPRVFPWWDFDRMLADVAPVLDGAAREALESTVSRCAPLLGRVGERAVLCHGDVHPGNVLVGADGPLLIDWDLMCRADPAWDHAMLTTYAERWGGPPEAYPAFAEGYGESLADDDLTQALGTLRNVAATLMRVVAGRDDPAAAVEAERRLRWWRGDPDAPTWRAQ